MFWLGILPRILTKTLDVFCQKFSHKSNYELVIEKPKLTLSVLPVANFSANKLVLKSKKTKDSFIIQELRTELRILPLLSGRLHLNEFKSKDFNLVLSLEKDVELGKNFFDELENTKFRCNFISVENYKFEFYQKDLREPILYSGKDFIYQRKNRFLKLKFDSSIKLNNKSTVAKVDLYLPKNNDIKKTVFDINISNFDIAPLRSYLKHYLPEDLVALNGIINVQADKGQLCSEIIKGAILYKDVTKSIYLPEKINIVSSFKINRDFINIENSTIKSKNVDVILSGKVFDYISKTATFLDLNILVNNSNVEDFIKMSPAFKVEEIDMQKLKKYKFYGKIWRICCYYGFVWLW